MKIDKLTFDRWQKFALLYVNEKKIVVDTIRKAWDIAWVLNIPQEAYKIDSSINDRHIETALKKIFPIAFVK